MSQVVDDSLEAGREAARRRAWREAYDLLRIADEDGNLTAEDLENLAEAAWWTGRLDEAIALRERAYGAYVQAGEPRRAAMLALLLSMDHSNRGQCRSQGAGSPAPIASSRTSPKAPNTGTSRSRAG